MPYYRRIRDLREDNDMTQRQLAAMLRLTQPQYCRYEQGYRDPPTDILIQLADIFGTSTDYILERTDDPTPPLPPTKPPRSCIQRAQGPWK
ncbi:MAG: helix-turn-helix domain-containing protein [Candidatus Fimadaptatus sp.]